MSKVRKNTHFMIVHCSATPKSMDIGAREINGWHLDAGIYSPAGLTGYHVIGRRDGSVDYGREITAQGAHALGWNDESIGYCMVGGARKAKKGETPEWSDFVSENNFTDEQFDTLGLWYDTIQRIWPGILLIPHSAVSSRSCPGFDLWEWQRSTFGYDDEEAFTEIKHKRNRARV